MRLYDIYKGYFEHPDAEKKYLIHIGETLDSSFALSILSDRDILGPRYGPIQGVIEDERFTHPPCNCFGYKVMNEMHDYGVACASDRYDIDDICDSMTTASSFLVSTHTWALA